MTDPLQVLRCRTFKEVRRRTARSWNRCLPAAIELDAKGALALITHMQIAAANPAVKVQPTAAKCDRSGQANSIQLQSRQRHS
jgi:hypothetical protein